MRDVLQSIEEEAVEEIKEVDNETGRIRLRSCKKATNDDPRQSNWFHNYVDNAIMSPSRLKKFRRRFRLPYDEFVKLKDCLNEEELFTRWHEGKTDPFGVRATPISLLLLGSLRYLGRGLTFDDIEEATNVSQETHRQFFHKFIVFGSTNLYNKYIVDYKNDENIAADRNDYGLAGFPGAVGSLDATHVVMERCAMSNYIHHKGFKMSCPTRTYNMPVNHRRHIISTTTGAPGSWNDKSVVRFDRLAMDMRTPIYDHLSFDLYEKNDKGETVTQTYVGGYFISDNGYQPWSIFIPPFKRSDTVEELEWSKWLESVRKDVECTFGILKGRWRILKAGCRLHGAVAMDRVFLTCCSLHNLLLERDGLNVGWKNGAQSDWQQDLGHFDPEDIPLRIRPPNGDHLDRLLRLDTSLVGRTYGGRTGNVSPAEECSDDGDEDGETPPPVDPTLVNCKDENGKYKVRCLTLAFFRAKLVAHFSICYEMGKVNWPRGKFPQRIPTN